MDTSDPLSFSHGPILQRLKERCLVPFLGAAASFVGAQGTTRLPDAAMLAKELLEGIIYPGASTDPITKIAQFLEEGPADRAYLLGKVNARFEKGVGADYKTAFMEFLEDLPSAVIPPLIITTNYDVLVERSLQRRNIPYMAMSQVIRGNRYAGRWVCYSHLDTALSSSAVIPLRELEEQLKDQQTAATENGSPQAVWVYKIHGTARVKLGDDLLDSIVLTESDYIDFLSRDILKTMPAQVTSILRRSSLLFLGYSLADWNFRVLLQRIRNLQLKFDASTPRHWAFLRGADKVEEQFWKLRGINMHDLSLDNCLKSLLVELRKG
jgi:hypothetical protein